MCECELHQRDLQSLWQPSLVPEPDPTAGPSTCIQALQQQTPPAMSTHCLCAPTVSPSLHTEPDLTVCIHNLPPQPSPAAYTPNILQAHTVADLGWDGPAASAQAGVNDNEVGNSLGTVVGGTLGLVVSHHPSKAQLVLAKERAVLYQYLGCPYVPGPTEPVLPGRQGPPGTLL